VGQSHAADVLHQAKCTTVQALQSLLHKMARAEAACFTPEAPHTPGASPQRPLSLHPLREALVAQMLAEGSDDARQASHALLHGQEDPVELLDALIDAVSGAEAGPHRVAGCLLDEQAIVMEHVVPLHDAVCAVAEAPHAGCDMLREVTSVSRALALFLVQRHKADVNGGSGIAQVFNVTRTHHLQVDAGMAAEAHDHGVTWGKLLGRVAMNMAADGTGAVGLPMMPKSMFVHICWPRREHSTVEAVAEMLLTAQRIDVADLGKLPRQESSAPVEQHRCYVARCAPCMCGIA
jgi:hypothetical protein